MYASRRHSMQEEDDDAYIPQNPPKRIQVLVGCDKFGAIYEFQDVVTDAPKAPKAKVDWHVLDELYLLHHFKCSQCISAGRGIQYGQRCETGNELWEAYLAA